MTYREHNQHAGRTFEGEAARLNLLTAVSAHTCRVHERKRVMPSGLIVDTGGASFELTDVRAA